MEPVTVFLGFGLLFVLAVGFLTSRTNSKRIADLEKTYEARIAALEVETGLRSEPYGL
jgi:hypothetical protein